MCINDDFRTFFGLSEAEKTARAACAAHGSGVFERFYGKTAANACLRLLLLWASDLMCNNSPR